MELSKRLPWDYHQIFVFFGLAISNVSFLFPLGEIAGIKLRVFHLLAPGYIVISILFFLKIKRIYISRSLTIYLSAYSLVLFSIVVVQIITGRLEYSEIMKQCLLITFILCLAPFFRFVSYKSILYLVFISAIPILFADLLALVRIIEPGATSISVVPFLRLGVIGVPVSFGTHGTVLVTSFFAGLGWLVSNERKYAYNILLVIILVFIFISQSRSSMIALVLPIIMGTFVFATTYRRLISILVTSSITIPLIIYFIVARLSTVSHRLAQYRQAISVIVESPIFGIGWDQFFIHYGIHLHNTPLNYFVASGILTGCIFSLALVYPLYSILKNKNISNNEEKMAVFTHLSMYSAVIVELLFYPQFPSVHMLIFGSICCAFVQR